MRECLSEQLHVRFQELQAMFMVCSQRLSLSHLLDQLLLKA
jgi:hypothetical protein